MNNAGPLKGASWARVSTTEQHTAQQTHELTAWAGRRGVEIVREFITEDSAWQSGNGPKGKEFDAAREELLNGARLGHYSVILVWSIDRLSRRGIEDTLAALRRLSEAGCAVWSHQEPWAEDLKDPRMRELFIAIAAWMAEMESARRSERIKAGIGQRKRDLAAGREVKGRQSVGGRKPGSKDRKPRAKVTGEAKGWTPERSAALAEANRQRPAARKAEAGEA